MKDDIKTPNTKLENFLESSIESYPNFLFKSPPKDKNGWNLESIPVSCKQTPVMSPLPSKYNLGNNAQCERTSIKKMKEKIKLTPYKQINVGTKADTNSVDKAKKCMKELWKEPLNDTQNKDKNDKLNTVDFDVIKAPCSPAKPDKEIKEIIKQEKQTKQSKRSPLIPNQKIDTELLSPESSNYEEKLAPPPEPINESCFYKNGKFSPRKTLDFVEKDHGFKGRNLFEDNYE